MGAVEKGFSERRLALAARVGVRGVDHVHASGDRLPHELDVLRRVGQAVGAQSYPRQAGLADGQPGRRRHDSKPTSEPRDATRRERGPALAWSTIASLGLVGCIRPCAPMRRVRCIPASSGVPPRSCFTGIAGERPTECEVVAQDDLRGHGQVRRRLLHSPPSSSDAENAAREEEDHSDRLLDGSCFIGGACISFPSASALRRVEREPLKPWGASIQAAP